MDDERTIYDDERTQLDNQKPRNEQQEKPKVDNATANKETPKKKGLWKKVAMGTGAGFVLAGAATLLTSATPDDDATDDVANTNIATDGEIATATNVNDDMSFTEAFNAARDEVGSGGVFEWHGRLYNTFTESEWENMTAEERNEFGNHFSITDDANQTAQNLHSDDEVEVVDSETAEVEVVSQQNAQQGDMASTIANGGEEAIVVNHEEAEVEILGVVHDNESGANIGGMTVNGQEVFMIDIDNDHTFEVMAVDENQNGQLEGNEMTDISAQNITVEDMGGITGNNGNLYAAGDEIDYSGDGGTCDI